MRRALRVALRVPHALTTSLRPWPAGALESPLALRPSAHMSGSQVRVRLELSDLTLHHRVAPLAVQAVGGPPR